MGNGKFVSAKVPQTCAHVKCPSYRSQGCAGFDGGACDDQRDESVLAGGGDYASELAVAPIVEGPSGCGHTSVRFPLSFRFVESRKVLGASQDLDLRSSDLIASVWDAFPRRYPLGLAETDPVRGKHPHEGARPGYRVVVFAKAKALHGLRLARFDT